MNGPQHFRRAEATVSSGSPTTRALLLALIHAVLALTAAVIAHAGSDPIRVDLDDLNDWAETINITPEEAL